MKFRIVATIGLLSTGLAFSQVPSGISRRAPVIPNANRFGNILYPGGLPAHQQTHGYRLGSSIAGRPIPGVTGAGYGGYGQNNRNRNRTIVVPYAVPVYYSDPGYYNGYGAQPQQNITVVVQPQAPSVVINNHYGRDEGDGQPDAPTEPRSSGLKVYEGPKAASAAPAPASDKPNIYLIALKDSTVRQAIGWWTEGEFLHYLTPQSSINRVSMDQVDPQASKQLNSERNLEFDLRIP